MAEGLKDLWNKFARSKKGHIVLWQTPNLPIIGWAIARLLSASINPDYLSTGFGLLGDAFLFAWAYLEITQGASYFRRALGALVMVFLIIGYFNR